MKQLSLKLLRNIISARFYLASIILLSATPAYAFPTMPVGSFDALGYFSFSTLAGSGDRKTDEDMVAEADDTDSTDSTKIDRSGLNGYFLFSPTDNWAFYINRHEITLNEEDGLYEQPAGPKNKRKTAYERTGLGIRTMFSNDRGSPVKVGVYNEFIVHSTADQDGEAFSTMPFFYIGHKLPLSLRYGYNVETSRRKTRLNDSSITKADYFYNSHVYIRLEPYNSVARFPVGYEYHQRSGTAPDPINFDVQKERMIEHSIFFNLPASILLTLKLQTSDDAEQLSLALEVPFF